MTTPEVAAQFEAMDLVDFGAIPSHPTAWWPAFPCIVFRLPGGKPFQAMPGTVYWDDGNGRGSTTRTANAKCSA